jgi:hypothetical protein
MIVSRLRTGFLEHNFKNGLHRVVEQDPLDPTYSELKAVRTSVRCDSQMS